MKREYPRLAILRNLWLMAGISLLLLLALEGLARLYSAFRPEQTESARLKPFDEADSSWSQAYLKEFESSGTTHWSPYTYWRRKPFSGKYINVDSNGLRATRNQTSTRRPFRIFVFGGSAVWGPWIRDDHTIPSLLARAVNEAGKREVAVTNFGESGYVSTQEVLQLILELRKGNVPDLALFYDGVNDAFSAYQNRTAGIPLNEDHRAAEFNSAQHTSFLDWLTNASVLVRKLLRLRDRMQTDATIARTLGVAGAEGLPISPGGLDSLANETIHAYAENMRLVNSLGREYGFSAIFFWQPTLMSKTPLSAEELSYKATFPAGLAGFFTLVHAKTRSAAPLLPQLRDLQDLFSGTRETVFIDYCHVRERWNNLIAQGMANAILEKHMLSEEK